MAGQSKPPHVVIIGAGIGGLFLAQFLRKQGVSFDVFERDASASARGQGFALGLHMLDELQAALPEDVPPLRSSCHLLPLDLPSQVVLHPPGGGPPFGVDDTPETPCIRANRLRLREVLLTGLAVHWDKNATRIEEDAEAGHVTVWFEDGSAAVGDLIVGADGTWSKVREHLLGRPNEETLEVVPTSMILGEPVLSGEALQAQLRIAHSCWIRFAFDFWLFFGVNAMEADGKTGECYWMLFLNDANPADPNHWLRTASRQEKYNYTLNRIAGFEDKFQEAVKAGGPDAVRDSFLVYYDGIIESLPVTRVTLLGDAAHPLTPWRGEGAVIAIKDAMELSGVIAGMDISDKSAVESALKEYQDMILKRGSEAVKLARQVVSSKSAPKAWGHTVKPMPQ